MKIEPKATQKVPNTKIDLPLKIAAESENFKPLENEQAEY